MEAHPIQHFEFHVDQLNSAVKLVDFGPLEGKRTPAESHMSGRWDSTTTPVSHCDCLCVCVCVWSSRAGSSPVSPVRNVNRLGSVALDGAALCTCKTYMQPFLLHNGKRLIYSLVCALGHIFWAVKCTAAVRHEWSVSPSSSPVVSEQLHKSYR